jgi:hypothetical protein
MKQDVPIDLDERMANAAMPKTDRQRLVEQIVALQRQIYLLERKLNEMDYQETFNFNRPPSR